MSGWWLVTALVLFIAWRFSSALGLFMETEGSETDVPVSLEIQDFTPHTLAPYNGVIEKRVLLGVKGRVYDVTAGKAHYGPGGPYENFAGRDASRGLAKHSFETSLLSSLDDPIDTLSDLTEEEQQALDQWAEFFAGKYPFVGKLKNKI